MLKKSIVNLVFILAASMLMSGCVISSGGHYGHVGTVSAPPHVVKPGPPPHAKAYGHRAKYNYYYYPDSYVYFDTGRSVYFYLDNDHWTMAVALPDYLHIDFKARVSFEMGMRFMATSI